MKLSKKIMEHSNTLLVISSIYTSLTKAEKKVADAVLANPERAVMSTVTDLSEAAGVGDTSVIRFCRKLGFRGYHDFKLSLAQHLVILPESEGGAIEPSDDLRTIAEKTTHNNAQMIQHTLSLLNMNDLTAAADVLLGGKRIFVCGVGSSGITALDIHYHLMRLGLPVTVQTDSHIMAMHASMLGEGDVVFGVSTSGSTKDLVDPVKQAKEQGAKVICLTSHVRSPITAYADIVLPVPAKETPLQGGALITKIAQMHVIDILSNLIMRTDGGTTLRSIRRTAEAVAAKLY